MRLSKPRAFIRGEDGVGNSRPQQGRAPIGDDAEIVDEPAQRRLRMGQAPAAIIDAEGHLAVKYSGAGN